MTIPEFKKVARLLKNAYSELEVEAIKAGIDLFSQEYTDMTDKTRGMVLAKMGFTVDEYREAKDSYLLSIADKKSQDPGLKDILDRVTQIKGDKGENGNTPTEEQLSALITKLMPEPIPGKTPTVKELLDIMRPLIPPVVNGETPSDEKLMSLIKPLIPNIEDPKPVIESYVGYLEDKITKLENQIKTSPDFDSFKEQMRKEMADMFTNNFAENFKSNTSMYGMPDFRRLAMGLQGQIDEVRAIANAAASASGGSLITLLSGTVDGSNQVFTFAKAPTTIFVDGVPRQKVQSDGTINWTGTTTITLAQAPSFDIFAY